MTLTVHFLLGYMACRLVIFTPSPMNITIRLLFIVHLKLMHANFCSFSFSSWNRHQTDSKTDGRTGGKTDTMQSVTGPP